MPVCVRMPTPKACYMYTKIQKIPLRFVSTLHCIPLLLFKGSAVFMFYSIDGPVCISEHVQRNVTASLPRTIYNPTLCFQQETAHKDPWNVTSPTPVVCIQRYTASLLGVSISLSWQNTQEWLFETFSGLLSIIIGFLRQHM